MVLSIDRVDLHSFLCILNETSTVVDLGMSDGGFARRMVSRFGCRVYGLEPEPSLFVALPDIDRVVKEQAAASSTDEPVTLHVNTTQCASTLFDAARTSVTVAGTTLTSFFDRHRITTVDLLKMDIEGAEFDVLASMNDLDLLRIRQLTIEFHDFLDPGLLSQVRIADERLRRLGFRRMKFTQFTNGDVLYIHPMIRLSVLDRVAILMVGKYLAGLKRRLRSSGHVG
jgi:FkbM family methyltransferase